MRPSKLLAALVAFALLALVPATALAGPKPAKHWNIYRDKLGVFSITTSDPKGQTLIADPFATQAEAQAYMASPPVLLWTGSIADGDSFYVGAVPAAPVVTVVGEEKTKAAFATQVQFSGYGTDVGQHLMVASATDVFGLNTTEQRGFTVALKPAAVVDPTAFDETFNAPGVANKGGISIPSVEGVDYFLDGDITPAAAGTHEFFASTHQVTAAAQPGYELTGYPDGGWALEILAADVTVEVTPAVPTAYDETANLSGGITITGTVGVDYFINGVAAAAGDNPLTPGDYVVTAAPQFGYAFNQGDVSSWNLTVGAYVPPPPSFTLTGSTWRITTYGNYAAGPAPVVDNAAGTITWTFPVTTAAAPKDPVLFQTTTPNFGRWTASIPESELVIGVTASVSPNLADQAGKFTVFYRDGTFGVSLDTLGTFPLNVPNVWATPWGAAVGGHHFMDNGFGANWANVVVPAGGGTVTIVMTFTA